LGDDEQVDALICRLNILGLTYCADTSIGNNMIRGISGGQRKRVTTGSRSYCVQLRRTPACSV